MKILARPFAFVSSSYDQNHVDLWQKGSTPDVFNFSLRASLPACPAILHGMIVWLEALFTFATSRRISSNRDRTGGKTTMMIQGLASADPIIHLTSKWMMTGARMPKPSAAAKTPDSEKITLNLGFVDLGKIDLLVREGFYSNRSDFIRTAIRNQIDRHAETVRQVVTRKSVHLGVRHVTNEELTQAQAAGQTLDIRVLGLAVIAPDVSPELARTTIAALNVLGALQASDAVKAVLADRMT